ncbi:hypothetical protein KFE25_009428 [Diacronema lutheri]|uniref:Uncharacterized protein n=1 Tax=Diacronema lutheri TaxID=2081491 RepID=A0A8J6CDH2_DIALT|nr:hypothetical protein KFE25_009428 [Diacronema lutheri]
MAIAALALALALVVPHALQCFPPGIRFGYSIANFFADNPEWVEAYYQPYSALLLDPDLPAVGEWKSAFMCATKGGAGSTNCQLAAFGDATVVLANTVRNKPVENNGVWWYRTPNLSVGFAPDDKIKQSNADIMDAKTEPGCNYRLSWDMDNHPDRGGWRAGCDIKLDSSTDFYRVLYLSKTAYAPCQPAPPPSPPAPCPYAGDDESNWRWSCGMCQRHRCTLYGMNKCAAQYQFTDPQGAQLDQCSCACCRIQCARDKGCPTDCAVPPGPLVEEGLPVAAALESTGSSRALRTWGVVLGALGVAVAAVAAPRALRARSMARAGAALI